MLEFSGDSYEKTMEDWSVNVGASFKKTRKKGLTSSEKGILKEIKDFLGDAEYERQLTSMLKKKPSYVWTGSFDLGVSGSLSTSESYEYYLNLYRVKMSEVRMNMSAFEQEKKDPALLALLSPTFVRALNVDNINTTAFYDDWGTDIITQGSFGGYNIYIYGRRRTFMNIALALTRRAASRAANQQAPARRGKISMRMPIATMRRDISTWLTKTRTTRKLARQYPCKPLPEATLPSTIRRSGSTASIPTVPTVSGRSLATT